MLRKPRLAVADAERLFPPVAPSVHLNGTGGMDLFENLGRVTEALNAAYDALRRAAPNCRDYYVQELHAGYTGFALACTQHQRRMQVIDALITELNDEQNLILDQLPERAE